MAAVPNAFPLQENTTPIQFSPDGTKLAYVSQTNNFDVYTVNIDGTGLKRITQDQGTNEDPTWSLMPVFGFPIADRLVTNIDVDSDGVHQYSVSGSGNYSGQIGISLEMVTSTKSANRLIGRVNTQFYKSLGDILLMIALGMNLCWEHRTHPTRTCCA